MARPCAAHRSRVVDGATTQVGAGSRASAAGAYARVMDLEFDGEVWFWRGPAPWYFVTVPSEHAEALAAMASFVSYGWGMIPVAARIGATTWTTSLFPKDGSYVLPVKASVRRAEGLDEGSRATVHLGIGPSGTN